MASNLLPLVESEATNGGGLNPLSLPAPAAGSNPESAGSEMASPRRGGLREPRGGGITALANLAVDEAADRNKKDDEGARRSPKRKREGDKTKAAKKGVGKAKDVSSGGNKTRKRKGAPVSYGAAMDGASHIPGSLNPKSSKKAKNARVSPRASPRAGGAGKKPGARGKS